MLTFFSFLHVRSTSCVLSIAALCALSVGVVTINATAQEALSTQSGPYAQPPIQPPAPIERQAPEPQPLQTQEARPQPLTSNYDPALFQRPIPKEQLAFLNQFAGTPSNQLYRANSFAG
jgi:hypothetical protein